MNPAHTDVIIIGGGPAGATAAALLAEFGRSVLVLERTHFPRHHIGESLMPQTYWTFKRLGVLDKLQASACPRKESVQFISQDGRESMPYFFTDRDPNEWSTTWQVKRDEFDCMMIDNAREKGADVRFEAHVRRVLFDGDRAVGVLAQIDGQEQELRAKAIIDASGMSTVLGNQLGLRAPDSLLHHAAIYGYYTGVKLDTGRNAGATIIIHTPRRDGWFWIIPLADGVTSIGVVAPPGHLTTGRGGDPAATLAEEIENCPGLSPRMTDAKRVGDVYVCADFSYRCRQMAGDGWMLIGDAFGFIDPVYSSGVMLALKSGELAADTIHEGLAAGDLSGERLRKATPGFLAGAHRVRQLVHAFYDKRFSFGKFLKAHPDMKDNLVRILIGDVFEDETGRIFQAMQGWTELPRMGNAASPTA